MSNEKSYIDQQAFDAEHAKRERRINEEQRRAWADGLIASLPDSIAYRNACTPQARLVEQARLNEWVEHWKQSQSKHIPKLP
jgi:hypothetical protein